jgi:DNA-binding Xre family transcriptional regulator
MQIPNLTTKKRLEDIRASAHLSDREIGEKVGLNQSNVWRLRTGKYKRTTDEAGIKIANLHALLVKQNNE